MQSIFPLNYPWAMAVLVQWVCRWQHGNTKIFWIFWIKTYINNIIILQLINVDFGCHMEWAVWNFRLFYALSSCKQVIFVQVMMWAYHHIVSPGRDLFSGIFDLSSSQTFFIDFYSCLYTFCSSILCCTVQFDLSPKNPVS